MGELLFLLAVITALVLVVLSPIICVIALIKPSLVSKIGSTRKEICLKMLGAFVLGCVIIGGLDAPAAKQKKEFEQQQQYYENEAKKLEEKQKSLQKEFKELNDNYSGKNSPMKPGIMTLDKFNRIQTGMTPEEVKEIVGGLGTVASESEMAGYKTVILQFDGSGSIGANANITFQNGKVVQKAQAGLK